MRLRQFGQHADLLGTLPRKCERQCRCHGLLALSAGLLLPQKAKTARNELFLLVVSSFDRRHTGISVFVDLDDLATTVETIGGHVVATMTLAGFRIGGKCRGGQCVVGTAHVTLGTRLAILLYGHGGSSCGNPMFIQLSVRALFQKFFSEILSSHSFQ
jgi:hypothetical protein